MKEIFNKILNNQLLTKDAKLYILMILIVWGIAWFYLFPPIFIKIYNQNKQISEASTKIIDLEKQKANAMATKTAEESKKSELPITIFKSSYATADFEGASMELVYKFLKIIGSTGNKITEISMTPNAKTDSDPAGSLNVSMSIDCTYISLQNLLQQVSTWNYLAEIKNVRIEPVKDNETRLTAKLSINLYVLQ